MAKRPEPLRAALAQINPTVGDIAGNARLIADRTAEARDQGAQLVVFPELALTGYPPEDLLLKTHFLDAPGAALRELAAATRGIVALVGFPERADDVYNSAAVLADGEVAAIYRKLHLPNYGVFDEQRYFQAGDAPATFKLNGVTVGLTICEDIWEPGPPATLRGAGRRRGDREPVGLALPRRARAPSASGCSSSAPATTSPRCCSATPWAARTSWSSTATAWPSTRRARSLARAPQFEEALTLCTVDPGAVAAARLRDPRHRTAVKRERASGRRGARRAGRAWRRPPTPARSAVRWRSCSRPRRRSTPRCAPAWATTCARTASSTWCSGCPGGIDSALVALLAVDALGADRVTCVSMPSPYSSEGTRSDARAIAANLGTELLELSIEDVMARYDDLLGDAFSGREPGLAQENLQARIRGNVVMALSNEFGWLVLTTGNKSELSVGYATLYGDMAGGFAVLKDVFKGWVYRLVRWRNAQEEQPLVPESVLDRPPSAELRADQLDEDSLPPYEVLDAILAGLRGAATSTPPSWWPRDCPREDVERVIRLVDRAEYKRRQAPPGIRISTKAFGRDRRLPITNRYQANAERPEPKLRALVSARFRCDSS